MKKNYITLRLFVGYILILLFMLISSSAMGQSPCDDEGICVTQFNAGFNDANKVTWVGELGDCNTKFIDIMVDAKAAGAYKIVVVPTIVIYSDGEEVARFQANIMMKMEATQKEIQGKIDEIIMDSF
jgi:hypothetical protein|tara:strand:+ start:76 stop:456 length:381 start_codon:yes stop_codon:yes gene_type:complete